jgi:multidrug efflux system membrane fusion protein
MRRNYRKFIGLCIAVCLMAAVSGCGQKAQVSPDMLVKTQVVQPGQSQNQAQYAGEVKGRYESSLSFQASGRILSRNVQLGSRVHAGDVLMVIDPKDVVQAVNRSSAAVDSASAQLSLAESNLNRYQQLYAQNAVSAAVLDQYTTAYNQATAAYNQAQAAYVQEQNALSYTNLTADADGIISSLSGEVGQVVAAGQTVAGLVHSDELEVEIHVPENHVQDFAIGKETTVSFWALQNQEVTGTVREVAPMADSTARTYKVRISLPQPPTGMQLGMTATVTCDAGNNVNDGTVILPLSAIYQTGNTPQVWIVDSQHKLALKDVSVESFSDNEVKVKGLSGGEVVVTAGVHKLSSGQSVRTEGDAG